MDRSLHKTIVKSISAVIGKKKHQLHEPLFIGNEINYLKKTINLWKTKKTYLLEFISFMYSCAFLQ